MTQTTSTRTEAAPEPDMPLQPSDILMNIIVAFLAPMFLSDSGGDIRFARLAAIETVNAYRAQTQADLIAIAQIVGFGLAALGSLSLSMDSNLSLSMTLRLRGNANALNRSAEQNRRALTQHRLSVAAAPPPETRDDVRTQPSMRGPSPPAQATTQVTDRQRQEMWAAAAAKVAAEYAAAAPGLPPEQGRAATFRAAALNSCARDLLTGPIQQRLRPGDLGIAQRHKAEPDV